MQTTSRRAPIIGALLLLCACAESATTAPAAFDAATQALEISVPNLTDAGAVVSNAGGGPRRTSDAPLPPELDGYNVPAEFRTAPTITGHGLDVVIGDGTATGYAWMSYWGTSARLNLSLSTVLDGKPGYSASQPSGEDHLFPGNYMLSASLTIPFAFKCGGALSGLGSYSAWHQFPLTSGTMFKWGEDDRGDSKAVSQEACVEEYRDTPTGGSNHEDAVLPEEDHMYLCRLKQTYTYGILTASETVYCVMLW